MYAYPRAELGDGKNMGDGMKLRCRLLGHKWNPMTDWCERCKIGRADLFADLFTGEPTIADVQERLKRTENDLDRVTKERQQLMDVIVKIGKEVGI